jgi:trk system potassium uptake protein
VTTTPQSSWWRDDADAGYAVIGLGRFGAAVCEELIEAGVPLLAVDASERAIAQLLLRDPALEARVADCTDEESLREAGVLDMPTVVVAIGSPIEVSVTATLIARVASGSRVRRVIARASSQLHQTMLERLGADLVVFPSRQEGLRLGRELARPGLLERLRLDGRHAIEERRVPRAFVGRTLAELDLRAGWGVTVLAAGPDQGLTVNPPADLLLQQGDLLVLMGTNVDLGQMPGG